MLDMLCLTGEVGWARLSAGPTQVVGATPIALFLREHADAWLTLAARNAPPYAAEGHSERVLEFLRMHGASFANEIGAACDLTDDELRTAVANLVAAGAISSDGFEGLRAMVGAAPNHMLTRLNRAGASGHWFLIGTSEY